MNQGLWFILGIVLGVTVMGIIITIQNHFYIKKMRKQR